MRLLESHLLLANLLAVLALLFTWPRQGRWLRQVVFIPVMLAGAHVLMEGPRWQMVPAYALTGLTLLVWARRRIVPPAAVSFWLRIRRIGSPGGGQSA